MTCEHLRQLYELCQNHDMKISSADVVRIVCNECNAIEVCPSVLSDEYESRNSKSETKSADKKP